MIRNYGPGREFNYGSSGSRIRLYNTGLELQRDAEYSYTIHAAVLAQPLIKEALNCWRKRSSYLFYATPSLSFKISSTKIFLDSSLCEKTY
jgi:hypothetical protein